MGSLNIWESSALCSLTVKAMLRVMPRIKISWVKIGSKFSSFSKRQKPGIVVLGSSALPPFASKQYDTMTPAMPRFQTWHEVGACKNIPAGTEMFKTNYYF